MKGIFCSQAKNRFFWIIFRAGIVSKSIVKDTNERNEEKIIINKNVKFRPSKALVFYLMSCDRKINQKKKGSF
jgi:hypothetical protein